MEGFGGLGFKVQGSGFRVWDAEFGLTGLRESAPVKAKAFGGVGELPTDIGSGL